MIHKEARVRGCKNSNIRENPKAKNKRMEQDQENKIEKHRTKSLINAHVAKH